MKYCTSCGEKSGHKICKSCGVKENKEHKYCGWCGAPLNENAAVCTNCGTKVKPNILLNMISAFAGVVVLILAALFIYCLIAVDPTDTYNYNQLLITAIATTIAGVLCLPMVGNVIKGMLLKKQMLQKVIGILRLVLIVLLIAIGLKNFVRAFSGPSQIRSQAATEAAVVVFHEEVSLKNEDSFVLNDSQVYSDNQPYEGYDNIRLVKVVLDYSAQNGFGGNNRTTYTVTMYFNTSTGYYYRLDGSRIG